MITAYLCLFNSALNLTASVWGSFIIKSRMAQYMAEKPAREEYTRSRLQTKGIPANPLENVLLVDEFEESRSGYYPMHTDNPGHTYNWGTVTRSSMTAHRWGSYGSQSGAYSLKVATQPKAGYEASAIKRITMPYTETGEWYSRMRFESFFAYHEEPQGEIMDTETRPANEELTGESAVRSFMFGFDLHNRENRWWPVIKYHNYEEEKNIGRWEYNPDGVDPERDSLTPIPGAEQDLCWNSPNDSVPWKPNWHYIRIDFDMDEMRYDTLQCNDMVIDMSGLDRRLSDPIHEPGPTSPWGEIDGLLNILPIVETNKDTRSFLFLDSAVLSMEA